MKLTGLHLLLTYSCTYECDHCFVWGSPRQRGTLTLSGIRSILTQAEELGTVEWIYFEGGEPFMYYATLKRGIRMAHERGFKVGVVSNAYWATQVEDAEESLRPFAGLIQDLSISSDPFHGSDANPSFSDHVQSAAHTLGIPCSFIHIAGPEETMPRDGTGQIPAGSSPVMFRGRAAARLASHAPGLPAEAFDSCPYENLREPDRVHIDPFGHVHLCQGISLGNLFESPLSRICEAYDPDQNPVIGPLTKGGPAELARRHDLPCSGKYADACHLCDEVRHLLRSRYPRTLAPDQVYGVE